MSLPRLIRVDWVDIVRSVEAWTSPEDLRDFVPSVCHSAGWLVKDEEDHLVLSTHIGDEGTEGDLGVLIAIPKCVISSIYDLHPAGDS